MGDAEKLHQVFLNFFINACDSICGKGHVTVSTSKEGRYVAVTIEDTGHGIDEENMPYLFEPFFSTKGRSGTGLGLFVSNAIIVDHGGKIEVDSKKGRGTRFKILLPIRKKSK